jgi:pimeloyl-ACP methyl ester carboxylesterase
MPLHTTRFGHGRSHTFFGVHGWGSGGRQSFVELAAHLPEDATLWAPDLPGCGESAQPESWDMGEIHAQLFEAFDACVGDGPVTLIGSCSGSFHALPLALARPDKVSRIVLLEPFAYMPWFFGIFLAPVTGYPLYKMVFDNPLGRAATRASLKRQGGDQEKVDMVGAFGSHGGLQAAYKYLKHYGSITDHKVFASVTQPVRIICGGNSFKAVHRSVELWRELWPELDAHALKDTGHMLSQEAPARTSELIFSWR